MIENKKYKILIVEDDESLNNMYKIIFDKEWFEVEEVKNWQEALDKLEIFKPDIVLLDLMMPIMDWFEVLRFIRKNGKFDFKVIMFTNLDRAIDHKTAQELWVDDFIVKANILPKEIVLKIRNMLEN